MPELFYLLSVVHLVSGFGCRLFCFSQFFGVLQFVICRRARLVAAVAVVFMLTHSQLLKKNASPTPICFSRVGDAVLKHVLCLLSGD